MSSNLLLALTYSIKKATCVVLFMCTGACTKMLLILILNVFNDYNCSKIVIFIEIKILYSIIM